MFCTIRPFGGRRVKQELDDWMKEVQMVFVTCGVCYVMSVVTRVFNKHHTFYVGCILLAVKFHELEVLFLL
jgi:hypothetical protein